MFFRRHFTVKPVVFLAVAVALLTLLACRAKPQVGTKTDTNSSAPTSVAQPKISWPSNPFAPGELENEGLRRAWVRFEASQPYRLAMPPDRVLSPAARARVDSNAAHQIIPFISWWGAKGFEPAEDTDIFVAIVVNPSRSDVKRYGLIVIAASAAEGREYRVYWVARDEDMESYLLSPASGSIFIELYRRNGPDEIKELAWNRRLKTFELK